jgi:tetratricopeptide (TPR) repeat protein
MTAYRNSCPPFLFALVLSALLAAPAPAEEAGQAALDEATEAKLTAESVNDLGGVIRLCHQAIEAGLDASNKEFAKNLLAGTLLQRAEFLCGEIFDRPTPPARWPEMRQLAVADLEESLEVKAGEPDAHYLIARLQALPGGDRDRAAKAIDQAVKLSGKEPSLKAKALALRSSLGDDLDKRRADLDEAAKLAPHNAEVLRSRGLFLLQQNEFEAALEAFDAALGVNPNQADALEARGVTLFMMKKYDEAMKSFDKVIELSPNSPLVYTHRARIHALNSKYEESLAELDKCLQLDPDFSMALLLRARIYQQQGEAAKALADVNGVLRKDPDQPQARQLHALLLAGNGKLGEAIDDLEQLRDKDPNDADLLLQLGMFYSASQQTQKALETFTAVVERNPGSWVAYRSRGDAYLGLGKQAAAIADYESALKLDPENSGVLNNLAWVLATSPDEKLRDGKRAIELATTACKVTDYKQAHILSTLAAGYAESGDFKNAILWSTKAVEAGEASLKEQLGKELASYKEGKPWREALPPALSQAADESKSEERAAEKPKPDDATSKAPAATRKR